MASVISSVDTVLTPVVAQANAPPRTINSPAHSMASLAATPQDVTARPRYTEYAKLARSDDQVSEIAKSVREADKALGKVENAVQDLKKETLHVIKNFPPFPPNDERVQYLMSINGFRKELQAMDVPAVAEGEEPVFYPRESKLPELDPKSASEKDLRDYADTLKLLEADIEQAREALKSTYEALPKKINQDLVIPLNGEAQAGEVSRQASGSLQRTGLSVLGDESALTELEQ